MIIIGRKPGKPKPAAREGLPTLKAEIEACFDKAALTDFKTVEQSTYKTEERGHGREELRHYHVIINPEFAMKSEWTELNVIGKCFRRTIRDGKPTEEVCYFIGSRKTSAKVYGNALRGHWGIENTLHWSLDVTFAEDANRVSRRHGAENLAACRRVALSLLKQHPEKKSLACKRVRAAVDLHFLEEVLRGDGNLDKI
jgi:predicted transposase YbfD/YdcC